MRQITRPNTEAGTTTPVHRSVQKPVRTAGQQQQQQQQQQKQQQQLPPRQTPRKNDLKEAPIIIPIPSDSSTLYIPLRKPKRQIEKRKFIKKKYPELGRSEKTLPITNIAKYLEKEKVNFKLRYHGTFTESNEDEFEYIRYLGQGSYGVVSMVRRKDNHLYYASKALSKHNIVLNRKFQTVKNEKLVLQSLRFPFTIHLKYFCQDAKNIYFILPLMAGGELYGYIQKMGRFDENLCCFIMSQLLLALEYLHFLGLIHRDLKLENILIDHVGYIKLGDFGMCKWVNYKRTYTVCGTAEYLAPEVLDHSGYGIAADWWSFGILAFEICAGQTPFLANEYFEIFHLISKALFEMPKYFSIELSDLVTHLLEKDLTKRYGNLKNGVNDIKKHDFFKDMNWLELINRKIASPLLPMVTLPNNSYFKPEPPPTPPEDEITKPFDERFINF